MVSGKKRNKKASEKDKLIAELRAKNSELEQECELLRGRLFLAMHRKGDFMYNEFEKELRGIRRKRNISNYQRWTESRGAVDKFYSKNAFGADILYDRLTMLKRKCETFKLIGIPIYITLVFGIFITLGINTISMLLANRSQFLVETKNILNKALLTLLPESIRKATMLHDEIVNKTLCAHTAGIIIIIVCLIAIAALLGYLIYPVYRIKNSKAVAYQYEIEVIELLLKKSESESRDR